MECIACKSKIPDAAKVCSVCKSYQREWRNWLPYGGAVTALVTFVLSAMLYMLTTGSDLWQSWASRDEVKVLAFRSNGESTFYNKSRDKIILLRVEIEFPDFGTRALFNINEAIGAGELFKHREQGKKGVAQPIPEAELPSLINDGKIWPVFFDSGHAALSLYQRHMGTAIRFYSAEAKLVFYSVRSNREIVQTFQCKGVFHRAGKEDPLGLEKK